MASRWPVGDTNKALCTDQTKRRQRHFVTQHKIKQLQLFFGHCSAHQRANTQHTTFTTCTLDEKPGKRALAVSRPT